VPLHIIADLMGHSSTETTEVDLRVIDGEKRKMVLDTWSK